MSRPKIAIVSGGFTGEYEVSINTGRNIKKHLQSLDKYDLHEIIVDSKQWVFRDGETEIPVDKNDFSVKLINEKITFDAVFLTIHGSPGEDGKMPGYLDMLGIPYCMCGVLSSALTFNKKMANQFLEEKEITHIAKSLLIERDDNWTVEGILKQLSLPVFVKPNEGGSSLATFKISEKSTMESALREALAFDDQALIEEFIEGREFSVGVFENGAELVALPVTELISKNEFFDYESKYTQGMTDEITPAEIPDAIRDKIQSQAKKIFTLFQCSYFVRIDFIWKKDTEDIYFLEVNTMPGQSDASILPQQIREYGLTLPEFYDKMLSLALGS